MLYQWNGVGRMAALCGLANGLALSKARVDASKFTLKPMRPYSKKAYQIKNKPNLLCEVCCGYWKPFSTISGSKPRRLIWKWQSCLSPTFGHIY
jgi:hypothetical protein